jgi:hypothetical protein
MALVFLSFPAVVGAHDISLQLLGSYRTGLFDAGASEIAGYDPGTHRLFVTNAAFAAIDALDISDPSHPSLAFQIDISTFGAKANSVSVKDGVVAAAVEASIKQDPGLVVFFDVNGGYLADVVVGALPDMLTFSPDGAWVLVANEGEPNDDYTVDPEGSVSIIDVSGGAGSVSQGDVSTVDFNAFNDVPLDPSIRIYGPGATVAQDVEPEYIAVSPDSRTAWVTLQENNAIAIIDIDTAQIVDLVGLGVKNHNRHRNKLDASNEDGAIRFRRWPVLGFPMPDAIAAYEVFGHTFLITANEGDSRDYSGFSEEARVEDLTLDPTRFPNAASLQQAENLGRLKVTTANGDFDGDGDFDALFSYGARSFTIWTGSVKPVYESGSTLERITAKALPDDFNSSNDENGDFDGRSDDKGPEPEGVVIGKIGHRTYAFIGLERIGGIVVYDVSFPFYPRFVEYVNPRDFLGDPEADSAGDLGPEGLLFIPREESPISKALLVTANEVSGSTTIYAIGH